MEIDLTFTSFAVNVVIRHARHTARGMDGREKKMEPTQMRWILSSFVCLDKSVQIPYFFVYWETDLTGMHGT